MQEQLHKSVQTVSVPTEQEYKAPDITNILTRPVATKGSVRVVSGANQDYYSNLVGKKVSQVRKTLKEVYNISDAAEAYVNGEPASEERVLADGQQLEFLRAAGMKGVL